MMDKIEKKYYILKEMNEEFLKKLKDMRNQYKEAVKEYEKIQSEFISEKVQHLIYVAKELFPNYEVLPIPFGIRIQCYNGISRDMYKAENENSGLGSWNKNPSIYQQLQDKLGPNIIKTTGEDIAWLDAPEDSELYTDKTSWVYISIDFEFKKPYLNNKFGFKTAPKSKI